MEANKYVLIDRSGHGEHVVMQSGWSKRSKDMVRFTINDKSFVCKRKELLTILFYIGDKEEQQSMVTKNIRKIVYSQKEIKFKAQKDYRQGDDVYAMVEVPVEVSEQKSQPISLPNQ